MIQAVLYLAAELLLPVVSAVLLAIASLAVKRLADWLKLSADDKVRGYLLATVEAAVRWAQEEVARRLAYYERALADVAPDRRVPFGEDPSDLAAGYVAARVPDALKRFRIDEAGLRDIIETRLSRG